jgi:hypothetical protein
MKPKPVGEGCLLRIPEPAEPTDTLHDGLPASQIQPQLSESFRLAGAGKTNGA